MSNKKARSYWVLIVDALLALVVASQIAAPPFHDLGSLGEIIAFGIVFGILVYADRWAVQKGWGPYRRASLKIALFLGLLIINIASALRQRDSNRESCHRIFCLFNCPSFPCRLP